MPPLRPLVLTTRHLSLNPRAVRVADVLAGEGLPLAVLTQWEFPPARAWDRTLESTRSWPVEGVQLTRSPASLPRWLLAHWRRRSAQKAWNANDASSPPALLGRALGLGYDALLRRARLRRPTHLFVHHLDALGVAVALKAETGASILFDAEDDHLGELPPNADPAHVARVQAAMDRWLPSVDLWTASSAPIAETLIARHGLRPPAAVAFNTQPLATTPAEAWDGVSPLKVYWCSQTIGPGRGLEAAVSALATIAHPIELFLRGRDHLGHMARLRLLARGSHLRLVAAEPCPPHELPDDAAAHHLALSVEVGPQPNYRINAPNKLFQALSAGLAPVYTATPGQFSVLGETLPAACALDPDAPESWAPALAAWLTPENVRRAQLAARALATSTHSEIATQAQLSKVFRSWLNVS